MHIFDVAQQS